MEDLIKRQDVFDVFKKVGICVIPSFTFERIWNGIEKLPSADPERTVNVKRVSYDETMIYETDGECECGKCVDALWDYCPSCGAKLKWGEK